MTVTFSINTDVSSEDRNVRLYSLLKSMEVAEAEMTEGWRVGE